MKRRLFADYRSNMHPDERRALERRELIEDVWRGAGIAFAVGFALAALGRLAC